MEAPEGSRSRMTQRRAPPMSRMPKEQYLELLEGVLRVDVPVQVRTVVVAASGVHWYSAASGLSCWVPSQVTSQ